MLQSLREDLAKIHKYKENYIGSPSGNFKVRPEDFKQHLKDIMAELVFRLYHDQERIKGKPPEINDLLDRLPVPEFSTIVLVDMDPTQFYSTVK